MIIDPSGRVLAGPDFSGETILTAELDTDDIPRSQFDFDAIGHYARPDIFKLIVNDQPMPSVVFAGAE
jgi:nitrilase